MYEIKWPAGPASSRECQWNKRVDCRDRQFCTIESSSSISARVSRPACRSQQSVGPDKLFVLNWVACIARSVSMRPGMVRGIPVCRMERQTQSSGECGVRSRHRETPEPRIGAPPESVFSPIQYEEAKHHRVPHRVHLFLERSAYVRTCLPRSIWKQRNERLRNSPDIEPIPAPWKPNRRKFVLQQRPVCSK